MIKVLQNWKEVGEALGCLTSIGHDRNTRVYHSTPAKNWDLAQIAKLLKNKNKNIRILDMGCGGSSVLRFCFRNHFTRVYGIDLSINFTDRWQQIMYWKNNGFKLPYRLSAQSVTKTNFPNNFFDTLICLSVIEHDVDLEKFFLESERILKKRGILYISTDYWETKIETSDAPVNYGTEAGKEWIIFSREEIKRLIKLADNCGLKLRKKGFPRVDKRVVNWNTKDYTFLSMEFIKK